MERLTVALFILTVSGLCAGDNGTSLHELFFKAIEETHFVKCIRLLNATHQIGCSASSSHARGVLYHVREMEDISRLSNNPLHAPYIALLEEELFTGDGSAVMQLKRLEPTVKGIIVRYDVNFTAEADLSTYFSPEKKCPNEDYGEESVNCNENTAWNEFGTNLLYTDFGDFPIFAVETSMFDDAVQCYNDYNNGSTGGHGDFPLCSVELVADMRGAVNTPTCIRRGKLPIPYLNGVNYCDPLGDLSVWGSLFNLTSDNVTSNQIIMLATKLDSVSLFPLAFSRGASEVAAIGTLLAILEQLGEIKRNWNVTVMRPIVYSFFQGESWDYIGSSRMAYDMQRGDFPENDVLPRISLEDISYFLELGQLGLISNRTVYIHGNKTSELVSHLTEAAAGADVAVELSSRDDLPPGSLERFTREGQIADVKFSTAGSVLASFSDRFDNRFFGSRYDDKNNFGKRSLDEVADDLAAVATVVAKAVFNISQPTCDGVSCETVSEGIRASNQTIRDVLHCFLANSSCELFKSVLIKAAADSLPHIPFSRYVTANTQRNPETVLTRQLVAYYTANNASERENPVKCSDCLKRISDKYRDKSVNITWMQYNVSSKSGDQCLCVESFTYTHSATSPAFDYKEIPYDTEEYSTWTESGWTRFNIRLYLVTYPLQEVGFFFIGVFFILLTILFSVQCTRQGTSIFAVSSSLEHPTAS